MVFYHAERINRRGRTGIDDIRGIIQFSGLHLSMSYIDSTPDKDLLEITASGKTEEEKKMIEEMKHYLKYEGFEVTEH